jgi:Cu/Ag efflux pump CusA
MDLVSDAIGGREAGQVIRGNERYNINVRLVREARASAKSIRSLILEAPTGAWARLLKRVFNIDIEHPQRWFTTAVIVREWSGRPQVFFASGSILPWC